MTARGTAAEGSRLVAVDALRGLAAIAVVLFHYTTRFGQLYGGADAPTLAFPHGHYGVNLFFVISGFVIFMTLDRTRRPMDFVVSRFSRLFPAYWLSVALTFCVVLVAGLPGKEVTAGQAVMNVFMVHGLFGVPHVDGVYWTLEIELLFYAWMLFLYVSGRLHRIHAALWALFALRVCYHVASTVFAVDLSWTLSHLLILDYLPWFALGICAFQASKREGFDPKTVTTIVAAVAVLSIVEAWWLGAMAAAFWALVWAAATGRTLWLANSALAFLGAISYPLYLLHENIGWVVQRSMQAAGWGFDASIVVALIVAITLASVVTWAVERPAMRAIRSWYARSRAATPQPAQ